jgi:hypothetical protein
MEGSIPLLEESLILFDCGLMRGISFEGGEFAMKVDRVEYGREEEEGERESDQVEEYHESYAALSIGGRKCVVTDEIVVSSMGIHAFVAAVIGIDRGRRRDTAFVRGRGRLQPRRLSFAVV